MAEPSGSSEQEWEKLRPAIGQASRADDLLFARRDERGKGQAVGSSTAAGKQDGGDGSAKQPAPSSAGATQQRGAGLLSSREPSSAPWEEASGKTAEVLAASAHKYEADLAKNETKQEHPGQASHRRSARDQAVADYPRWLPLRGVLIALAVPVLTLVLSVRAVASSAFLWLEYHRPGFPADSYGFSTADRMTYGSYGLNYVLNFAPEPYLQNLRTEEGHRLFLTTEVEHMTDVKYLMISLLAFATVCLVLALLASLSLRQRAPGFIRRSVFWGALSTLALTAILAVIAILGWEPFFTRFHKIFFPQGNWEFRMSDTLIRLYPPQFWIDSALTVGVLVLVVTGITLVATWPTKARRALALKRAEEREELRARLSR